MFYSHEVLTSRKYGVATVWLVATLGSKSTLKKVNRKAILEVDVPKACETILTPEAPMALRLQSNLLYGVSRVYSQQCGYVLADAQNAQNNMKALLRVVRSTALDMEAPSTRPDQLLILDDPAFLVDNALPGSDVDFSKLDLSSSATSLGSSLLSPQSKQSSQSSDQHLEESLQDLIIPSSGTGGVGDVGSLTFANNEEGELILEDDSFYPEVDFEFDADGNQRYIDVAERQRRQIAAGHNRYRLASDSATSGQVRQEHQEGARGGLDFGQIIESGEELPQLGDDFELPEGEAFPPRVTSAEVGVDDVIQSANPDEEDGSFLPFAATYRRKRPALKVLDMDYTMELRSAELVQWSNEYASNMTEIAKPKERSKFHIQAKKNALFWVAGTGIGDIGKELSSYPIKTPLVYFSGDVLLGAITGTSSISAGKKRDRDWGGADESGSEDRRVRVRESDDEHLGRGDEMVLRDDGPMLTFDEHGLEIGRDAPSELLDQSTAMPWNVSVSLQGSRQGSSISRGRPFSGNLGGFPTSVAGLSSLYGQEHGSQARRVGRLTSASPLLGRGPTGELERSGSMEMLDDEQEPALPGGHSASDNSGAGEGFQVYGPGADVDTQTAAQSQWMRSTLDQESFNFLEFVKTGIDEGQRPLQRLDTGQAWEEPDSKYVTFTKLLPPTENTKVVAAQALLHALALATKNLLTIEQSEAYGEIKLGLIGGS